MRREEVLFNEMTRSHEKGGKMCLMGPRSYEKGGKMYLKK
jgi:hypothetical protein